MAALPPPAGLSSGRQRLHNGLGEDMPNRALLLVFIFSFLEPHIARAEDCLSACPKRKGTFGQQEIDRDCALKCLQDEDKASPSKSGGGTTEPTRLRFAGTWPGPARQAVVQGLVDAIPDRVFKAWVTANVVFAYESSSGLSWRAGVRPGRLTLYDSFWQLQRPAQESILSFELAKALWFERINPGPRETRTPRELEFEAVYRRHQQAIEAMRLATWRGAHLGDLTDRDMQSWFSYAHRTVIFKLEPPATRPAAYSPEEWTVVRQDWNAARQKVREYTNSLFEPTATPP